MAGPTREFWQTRFESRHTPWDRASASPQLRVWLSAELTAPTRIAVPGCGSGWEVAELAAAGHEVTALDYADAAVQRTRSLLAQRAQTARVEQALMRAWRLPDILIRVTDDRHADQPQVRNVALAIRLARHTQDDWDNAAIPDDITEIAELLNLSEAAAYNKVVELDS